MLNRLVTMAAIAAGGFFISRQVSRRREGKLSSSAVQFIEVDVPVSTAYNQWTQFESFPTFMKNVHEVRQIDDTHLHWRATVGGKEKEWEAEITEQIPDNRIAWRSTGGVRNAGVVTFHHITDRTTRIMLQMDYVPEGATEMVGDMLGAVGLQAKADLRCFKQMMESRGRETGAWRGTVPQDGAATGSSASAIAPGATAAAKTGAGPSTAGAPIAGAPLSGSTVTGKNTTGATTGAGLDRNTSSPDAVSRERGTPPTGRPLQ